MSGNILPTTTAVSIRNAMHPITKAKLNTYFATFPSSKQQPNEIQRESSILTKHQRTVRVCMRVLTIGSVPVAIESTQRHEWTNERNQVFACSEVVRATLFAEQSCRRKMWNAYKMDAVNYVGFSAGQFVRRKRNAITETFPAVLSWPRLEFWPSDRPSSCVLRETLPVAIIRRTPSSRHTATREIRLKNEDRNDKKTKKESWKSTERSCLFSRAFIQLFVPRVACEQWPVSTFHRVNREIMTFTWEERMEDIEKRNEWSRRK